MNTRAVRFGLAIALVAATASACSVVKRRSPEENYCRAALKELTRRGPEASVDNVATTARQLDNRQVAAVTVTYQQGPTRRLMTCFFPGGSAVPVRINFMGEPIVGRELNALDRRIRGR